DSAPYLHTGGKNTLDEGLQFYLNMAGLVRGGEKRNPDPEIGRIRLTPPDILPLRGFFRALTEDYSYDVFPWMESGGVRKTLASSTLSPVSRFSSGSSAYMVL